MTEKEWRTKIEKKGNKNKTVTCMLDTNSTISIINLTINGIYTQIKRQVIKVNHKARTNHM